MPKRPKVLDEEVVPIRDVEEIQVNNHSMFGHAIYVKINGESFRISKNDLVHALQHSTFHLTIKPARAANSKSTTIRRLEAHGTSSSKRKKATSKFESTLGE